MKPMLLLLILPFFILLPPFLVTPQFIDFKKIFPLHSFLLNYFKNTKLARFIPVTTLLSLVLF